MDSWVDCWLVVKLFRRWGSNQGQKTSQGSQHCVLTTRPHLHATSPVVSTSVKPLRDRHTTKNFTEQSPARKKGYSKDIVSRRYYLELYSSDSRTEETEDFSSLHYFQLIYIAIILSSFTTAYLWTETRILQYTSPGWSCKWAKSKTAIKLLSSLVCVGGGCALYRPPWPFLNKTH